MPTIISGAEGCFCVSDFARLELADWPKRKCGTAKEIVKYRIKCFQDLELLAVEQ